MSFTGIENFLPKPKLILKPKKVNRKRMGYEPEYFPDIMIVGRKIEIPYYVCEDCLTLNDDDHLSFQKVNYLQNKNS